MDNKVNIAAVIMAAGKGTRMKSDQAKVLHKILGRPIIYFVLEALKEVESSKNVIVIGHHAEEVQNACGEDYLYAMQTEQHGTGHALQMALPVLQDFDGLVLILSGDMPLVTPAILKALIKQNRDNDQDLTLLSADSPVHRDFGRIVRKGSEVLRIVEAKDSTPEEYAITEVNLGAYCAKASFLREFLPNLKANNAQGELYLTDLVKLGNEGGKRIGSVVTEDIESAMGINNRADLAAAGAIINGRIIRSHMLNGVTFTDPNNTYVEPGVKIGVNTQILPGTMLEGNTSIGQHCQIGPHTRLIDTEIANNVNITYSVMTSAKVKDNANIGPFAYLRPGSVIGEKAKVGDFVEIKNSTIGNGSKVPHLTYVGDSTVGNATNIGCGTITCNYDGKNKHRTIIGSNALIGSNTSLVAPVTIGDGVVTGAGAVVTKDVPENTIVVGVPAKAIGKR